MWPGGYRNRAKGGAVMPAKSQAQFRAMKAAAAGKSTLGIPQSVGQEFTSGFHGHKGSVSKLPEVAKAKKRQGGGDVTPLPIVPGAQAGRPTREETVRASSQGVPYVGPRDRDLRDMVLRLYNADRRSGPGPRGWAKGGPVKARQLGGPVDNEEREGNGPYLVGEKGPELYVPQHKGAIVPNKEVRKLGKKYAAKHDTLHKRGSISNRAYSKHVSKYGGKGETETTPIDASSR
jgi:hypothetical protein